METSSLITVGGVYEIFPGYEQQTGMV